MLRIMYLLKIFQNEVNSETGEEKVKDTEIGKNNEDAGKFIDFDDSISENDSTDEGNSDSEELYKNSIEKLNCLVDENEEKCVVDQLNSLNFSETNEYFDDSDNDEGWITPSSLKQKKEEQQLDISCQESLGVACITADYAMQVI